MRGYNQFSGATTLIYHPLDVFIVNLQQRFEFCEWILWLLYDYTHL
jgi:hypothetical protein